MNFYGPNRRGCVCVPLDNRRPDLVALHHQIMRVIERTGLDVQARYAMIERNGTIDAYAWRAATYGVLRLIRRGYAGSWQVEIRGDFSKPFPAHMRQADDK